MLTVPGVEVGRRGDGCFMSRRRAPSCGEVYCPRVAPRGARWHRSGSPEGRRATDVGALKGNPHDVWLCIDNMTFNAIDAMARADRQQLQPLLDADAHNAVRLPALMLSVGRVNDGNWVEIALRNRGPWIAPDLLLDNSVWQLRDTHAQEGASHRGRGIGLYCIKQIIDVGYGGDVRIDNVRNDDRIISLQVTLEDGSRVDVCLHLAAAESDNSPLLALGDAHARHTALLPSVRFESAASVVAIAQDGVAADCITSGSSDAVFVDQVDALSARWYAVRKNAALYFYPVDQRGVVVSLLIPANKFVS